MFTGIIEGLGSISEIHKTAKGARIMISAPFDLDDVRIGDSIAVNGACLTAVALNRRNFTVDVSPETLSATTLGQIKIGDQVNLERALKLTDRLNGHLVSGHVDGMGQILNRQQLDNAIIIQFKAPQTVMRYIIHKGSVAIDGVSLTVNTVARDSFSVSIIPHTAKLTTVGFKKTGQAVNIETDMIGKFVERLISGSETSRLHSTDSTGLTKESLLKAGFI